MSTLYPIRAVAKLTGISPETLRAWERRYQAVVPERSERGRQYGPAQIERLNRLNRLVQKGHAIGGIAALTDEELDALDALPVMRTVTPSAKAPNLLVPVISAIEGFDSARVSSELARLAAMLAPRDFIYEAVLPLMREVGTRWHDGRLAIAQEHLVSQLLRNLLGAMVRLIQSPTSTRRMLVATPGGEQHEFGILAASMLAAMSGIEPVYLGANLPAAEIARGARLASAPVVLLGLTAGAGHMQAEVEAVAEALPETTGLWLGGSGVGAIDVSRVRRPVVVFADLPAFEDECRRWRP